MRRTGAAVRRQAGAALAAALLLASCPAREAEAPARGQSPSARTPAPPTAGLRMQSRVEFTSMPEVPHRLSAVYSLPGRGLWRLEPLSGRSSRRRVVYRLADEVYHVPPERSDSERLEGREAQDVILQMELRLAALLWPDGYAWEPGPEGDRAALPGVGSLVARLGGGTDPLPEVLIALHTDGTELERLESIDWVEDGGRSRPRRWSLSGPEGPLLQEEILEIQPAGLYPDLYFLPADRLEQREAELQDGFDPGVVQQVVIPARILRRYALAAGSGWDAALAAAEELRERCSRETQVALDRRVEFVLGPGGAPRAVRLRLARQVVEPPSASWERAATAVGASQLVPDPLRIDSAALARLRDSMAEPERAGEPYALVEVGGARPVPAQLVVPLRGGS